VAVPVRVTLAPAQIAGADNVALTDVGADEHAEPIVMVALEPVIIARQPTAERALSMVYTVVTVGETAAVVDPAPPIVVLSFPPPVQE
jgi:hypothetical protein